MTAGRVGHRTTGSLTDPKARYALMDGDTGNEAEYQSNEELDAARFDPGHPSNFGSS